MNGKNFSPLKTIVKADQASLAQAFVDYFEERLILRLSEENPKPIGFATGRTMEPIYKELVSRLKIWPKKKLDKLLEFWESFNLDEYLGLSEEHSSSFRNYMYSNLVCPVGFDPNKIHIPDSKAFNPIKEAKLYASKLFNAGDIGLQILGFGLNGHIGFNEPPASRESTCRVVSLSLSTRLQNLDSFDNKLANVPLKAITLGMKEILKAEEIHLIVTGSSKSEILNKLLNDNSSNDLPASLLNRHERVFLWADEAAFQN